MRGKEKVMKGWKINGGKKNNLQSEMSSTRFLESISEKTHNNPILFWVYLKMTNAMMNCWQGPWLSDLTGFLFPDRWNKYFALTCSGCFFSSTEHRAVPSEFQAPRYRAEPAIGPDEPQADPNLPAVQSHQRETRPGPGQQEGERQRRRRSGTRLDTSDR